ncbi:unnamed protein product [Lactuca saligna]|uniref:Uncharacterized protein n=1 Tax=Lactuca saligna TaxID=75948 RepID=A0AA35ZZY6_LACSI|nr:unnamed protein product [Lactuca saligna]
MHLSVFFLFSPEKLDPRSFIIFASSPLRLELSILYSPMVVQARKMMNLEPSLVFCIQNFHEVLVFNILILILFNFDYKKLAPLLEDVGDDDFYITFAYLGSDVTYFFCNFGFVLIVADGGNRRIVAVVAGGCFQMDGHKEGWGGVGAGG